MILSCIVRLSIIFFFWGLCFKSTLAAENSIHIGVENLDYRPIIWIEDTEAKGFIPDLIDIVAKQCHFEVDITAFPVARLKKETTEGVIDIKFPDNPNWEVDTTREKVYSLPVVRYSNAYFSKKSHNTIKSVAVPLGFKVEGKPHQHLNIVYVTTLTSLFNLLRENKVDAIYLNSAVAVNYMNSIGVKLVKRDDMPTDTDLYYFSSINNNNFIDCINLFVSKKNYKYIELLKKYKL